MILCVRDLVCCLLLLWMSFETLLVTVVVTLSACSLVVLRSIMCAGAFLRARVLTKQDAGDAAKHIHAVKANVETFIVYVYSTKQSKTLNTTELL